MPFELSTGKTCQSLPKQGFGSKHECMSIRKIPFVQREFYHIFSRGNSKQDIFLDDKDRERFTQLLYLCNSTKNVNYRENIVRTNIIAWEFDRGETIIAIGAWVLMSNHFHLYVTPKKLPKQGFGNFENSLTAFMHKLLTSYSKYFNKKYNRTGSLFESKFKSVHIKSDPQAKYNFSYIHLNPIKLIDRKWRENGIKDFKKAKKFLKDYKWSSYLDYKGVIRPENKILDRKNFLDYFQNIKDFDSEILEWLKFGEEE